MSDVIPIETARLRIATSKGFRNWKSRFREEFGMGTKPSDISIKTLAFLAQGKESSTFFFFDLIMSLQGLGSGFEFNELGPEEKMATMDQYLFLLDLIRFEAMKRLGWLEEYPGEEFSLVECVLEFSQLAPRLKSVTASLGKDHPDHQKFSNLTPSEKEEYIRRLIPAALKLIEDRAG